MSELRRDLWASIYTESITTVVGQPEGWHIFSTDDLEFEFLEELDEGAKLRLHFDGVSWWITVKNTTFTDDELQCLVVRVFARLLEEVK